MRSGSGSHVLTLAGEVVRTIRVPEQIPPPRRPPTGVNGQPSFPVMFMHESRMQHFTPPARRAPPFPVTAGRCSQSADPNAPAGMSPRGPMTTQHSTDSPPSRARSVTRLGHFGHRWLFRNHGARSSAAPPRPHQCSAAQSLRSKAPLAGWSVHDSRTCRVAWTHGSQLDRLPPHRAVG